MVPQAADQGHAAAQNKLSAMYASGRGVQPDGAASPTPSVADVGTKPPSPITMLPSSAKGYSWWSGWDSYAECMDYYTKNPPIPSFPFYEHYTPEQYCKSIKRPMPEKKPKRIRRGGNGNKGSGQFGFHAGPVQSARSKLPHAMH